MPKKPRADVLEARGQRSAETRKGSETMENASEEEALRNLEALYLEGALTAAEFEAKTWMLAAASIPSTDAPLIVREPPPSDDDELPPSDGDEPPPCAAAATAAPIIPP